MVTRILLDCDGVLADFHTPCLKLINEIGGTDHKIDDFDDWNIFNALKTPKHIKDKVYEEMNKPGWCFQIGVYPGVIEGVKKISALGDLYIVTSPMRGDTWTRERDLWLMKYFNISSERVVHTSAKYICSGDVFIDDKIDNLNNWKRYHPNGVAVLWFVSHMANYKYDGPSTNDWDELADVIANLDKSQLKRFWTHD